MMMYSKKSQKMYIELFIYKSEMADNNIEQRVIEIGLTDPILSIRLV